MSDLHDFFATCAPGLEPILHAEAKEIGLRHVERQVGGVAFRGTEKDAWHANLWLRTSIRVLLRITRFLATNADQLYSEAREIAWEDFLEPEGRLLVDARTRSSYLDHSQFIEQVVKDAVVDRFRDATGKRPSVDKEDPELRINAHIYQDRVTLSADTSGHSLHRRGWRKHQGRAPLAETTAAALVQSSGWNGRAPLIDPFCGTGTILIEAGLMAGNRAPGLFRSFAFERWPGHDPAQFERAKQAARDKARPLPKKLRILGSDQSPERIDEARANAESAGLAEDIEFTVADLAEFSPRPGWNASIITNPPYGQRIGETEEIFDLYRALGDVLHQQCEGYSLTLLTGEKQLRKKLGFKRANLTRVLNGGIECEVVRVPCIGD